jgi:hypothetical protein
MQTRQRSLEDIGVLFGDSEEELKHVETNEGEIHEEIKA